MKPFIKWVGGKRQLLDDIDKLLPKKYNCYYEAFLGGGALLFHLKPKKAICGDVNRDLINTYNCFADDELYKSMILSLDKHQKNHSLEYYNYIRSLDRSPLYDLLSASDKASRFIYLNKSCFNGLYRVNGKGFFNVPFGKKESVELIDTENFIEIRKYLKNNSICFNCCDYKITLNSASKGDFVFLDPPYDLINETSFVKYSKDGFNRKNQVELFEEFKRLSSLGCYVMLCYVIIILILFVNFIKNLIFML